MKDDIELLSAFLDDELSKSERSALEARLENEPELAEQLKVLKANDEAMRDVFNSINSAPLPSSLTELLENENTQTQVYAAPKQFNWTPMLSAAACITLALAFTLGYNHFDSRKDSLEHTLSHVASGQKNAGIEAEFSFLTSDKKLCRQYLHSSALKNLRSISCHTVDGWKQVASVEVEDTDDSMLYAPAGASSNALDMFINNHISGAPLTPSEEKEALNNIQ